MSDKENQCPKCSSEDIEQAGVTDFEPDGTFVIKYKCNACSCLFWKTFDLQFKGIEVE